MVVSSTEVNATAAPARAKPARTRSSCRGPSEAACSVTRPSFMRVGSDEPSVRSEAVEVMASVEGCRPALKDVLRQRADLAVI